MKSMAQRAGEPHGIFGGSHPSEGVKALWAFHNLILAQLGARVGIFSWLPRVSQADSFVDELTRAGLWLKKIYS
ncbi:MAG TPA: hypothetical protein VKA60_06505 [Blastocatellia bacterium]|nr:hypothetical protein [Blastocatellia bacterium]